MLRTISTIGRSITGLFDFSGRISLATFWLVYFIPLAFCLFEMQSARPALPKPLWSLPITFLFFSGGAKRLHDRGHSGWWSLILLLGAIVVPVVGLPLLCLELCLLPGKPGDNEYGPGRAGRAAASGARLTLDPLDWLAAWLGFEGRISRPRFWFLHLLPCIVMSYYLTSHYVVTAIPSRPIPKASSSRKLPRHTAPVPSPANNFKPNDRQFGELGFACVLLYCAGQTKRLHDLNMPAALVTFIPPISLYFLSRCMFEPGSPHPNRFGTAPGAIGRTQSGSISRKEMAAAVGDALKRAKDDKLLIQLLTKEADSAALSKRARREACVALAPLLDRKGDFAGAAYYWRRALDVRFDPADGFKAALAQINADKGEINADTGQLLNRVLKLTPKTSAQCVMIEELLALAAAR